MSVVEVLESGFRSLYCNSMSYLLDFVKSFEESELKLFRQLDLIGKEELVRDEYANYAQQKNFSETNLVSKFKLTQSHFDKINSVILDKTIAQFYGNDYNKTFSSILMRGLTDLMLHEQKIIERKVLKTGSAADKTKFYKAAFENLRSMFHPKYNSKLTHEYGKKYLNTLGKRKTLADESYVAMLSLYGDIISEKFAGNEATYFAKAEAVLKKWEKKILSSKNLAAHFYYYFVLATLHKHLAEDGKNMLPAYHSALRAIEKDGAGVEAKFKGITLCEIGFANIEINQFETAQQFYERGLNGFPDTVGKSHYHGGNYFCVCLINRDYQKAQQAFEKYLLPRIQPGTNRSVLFDMYMMGCLFNLHRKNYDEAFGYLNELLKYRKNEITHFGLAMMRIYECIYFYRTKDFRVAAALVKKNLKFLTKEVGGNPGFEYYLQYVDAIGKLIKLQQHTLRSPEKLKQQLASLQKGIFTVFNRLLED